MLTSPQSVTISSVAHDLNKVVQRETSSSYVDATDLKTMDISHQKTSARKRTLVKIGISKTVTDPITGLTSIKTASVHVVFDRPFTGFESTEIDAVKTGLFAYLSAAKTSDILTGRH